MTPTALVSVDEYLSTDYSPDCDYVDGVVEDRNVGQRPHAITQKRMILFFSGIENTLQIFAIQEARIRVGPTRYRVPDLCVFKGGDPGEDVYTTPPFLCVEILSPDDRMSRMQEKIRDYLAMGVQYVWLIDPSTRVAWIYTPEGAVEAKDGILRTADPTIEMPLAEVLP